MLSSSDKYRPPTSQSRTTTETRSSGSSLGFSSSSKHGSNGSLTSQNTYTSANQKIISSSRRPTDNHFSHRRTESDAEVRALGTSSPLRPPGLSRGYTSDSGRAESPTVYDVLKRTGLAHKASGDMSDSGGSFRFKKDSTEAREKEREREHAKKRERDKERNRERRGSGSSNRADNFIRGTVQPRDLVLKKTSTVDRASDRENATIPLEWERPKAPEAKMESSSVSIGATVTVSQSTLPKPQVAPDVQDITPNVAEEPKLVTIAPSVAPVPPADTSIVLPVIPKPQAVVDAERIAAEKKQEREKLVLALLGSLDKVAIPSSDQLSPNSLKSPDTTSPGSELLIQGNRNSVEGLALGDEVPKPRVQAAIEVDPFSLLPIFAARMSVNGAPPAPLLMPAILPHRDSVLSIVPESVESIVLRRVSSHDWPDVLRLPQSPVVRRDDMSFRDSIFQLTSKEDDLIYSPPMQPLGTPSFIRHSLDLSVEQLPVPTTPRIEPTTTAPRRRRHSRSKPSISSSIGTSSLEESAMSIPKRVPSQILGISSVTTTVERSSQGADRPLSTTIIIKPSIDLQPTEDPIPPLPLPVPPSPSPPPPALLYVEPYEPLSPPKPRPSTLEPLNLPVTDIRPKQAESSRPLRSLNEMTRKRQSSVDSLVHTPSIHSVSSPSGTSKATPKLSLDLMSSRLPSMPSLPKATEPASIRSSPVATTNDVVRPFMADYSRHFIPKRSNSGPTTPGNAETSRPTTPAFQSALIHTPSPIIVPPRGEKEEPIMLVPVTPAPTSSGPSFTLPSWREKGQVIDSWASKSDPNTSLSISLQKVDSPLEQLVQNIEEAERTAESRKNSAGHVTPLEEPFHPPSPSPYIRQADDSQAAFLVYPQSVVDSPENVADAPLPLQVPSTPEMDISAALKKLLEIDTMNRVTDYAEHETVNLKTTAKTSTNLKALSRENSDSTPGRAAVPVPATSTTPNITTNSLTAAVPSETVPVRSARTLSNAKPPLALRKPSTEHIPITSRGSPLLPTAPPLPPQLPTEPINSIAPISSTSSPPTREAQKASGIGRSLRATSPTPPPKHESPTISTRSAAAVQISSSTTNRAPSPVNDIEPKSTPQRPPPQPASSHTHTRTASRDVHQDSTSRSRSSPTPPATSSHSKHRSNHRSHSSQNAPPSKDLPKIVPSNEQISAPTPQTTESTPKAAPPPPRKSHRSHNSADKEPKHSSSKPMPSVPTAGPTSSSHHGHRKTKSVPVAPAAPIRPPSPAQESLAGTPSSLASSVSDFHPTVLAPPPKKTGLFNFWKKNESAARGSSRDHTSSPTPMPPTHSIGSPLRKMTSRPKEPVHAPVVQRNTPSPIQIQPLSKTAARSISPALKVVATTAAVARSGRPSSKDKGLLSSFKVFGGRRVQSTLSNASMEAVLGYSGNAPNSPAPSSPEMPHSPYPSRDPNSAVQEWRKREAAIQTSRTRRPRPGVTWDVPNSPGSPSM